MRDRTGTEDTWHKCFERACRIRELAPPWEWMYEDQLFGVEDPESENTAWLSVKGADGDGFGQPSSRRIAHSSRHARVQD